MAWPSAVTIALPILTAANWLIDWWGSLLEPLEDRLLAALATFLRGASAYPQPQT
jgi:hypothetical protein